MFEFLKEVQNCALASPAAHGRGVTEPNVWSEAAGEAFYQAKPKPVQTTA